MPMLRTPAAVLALASALALAACGGDDDEPAARPAAATAAGDADRYCALARDLDAAGEEHFAGLGEDATPEQFERAERSFVERNAATLDELERAAPAEIRRDVRTLLAGMRQRAGLEGPEVSERAASAAEGRIKAFERRSCA
jgi:hypothetical protein